MPNLATPDPILSTEGVGAFAVMLVANIYILFGSNLSNEKQTALASVVTAVWIATQFVHAALVRKGRAQATTVVVTDPPA